MAQLGLGLIGVGKHGSRYARHICNDLPFVKLTALARRNVDAAQQQAEEFGCRAYADYRALIAAPEVDAVIVVVPPTLHPEIIEAAAAVGKPVLLEKPAAANMVDGERILRAVRDSGIAVMVAQTLRYNAVVQLLLQHRERLGRMHSVRLDQCFEPSRPGWIDEPRVSGGGMVLHTGIHCFDLVRLLSGREVERVSCDIASVRTRATEDTFSAVMRLRGDAMLACVAGSRATASRSGGIQLIGEHGQLIADHVRNCVGILHDTTLTPLPVPRPVATVLETVRDFAVAVERGAPMPIPLAEGLRAVAIVDACYRAARSGQAEAVPALSIEQPPAAGSPARFAPLGRVC